MIFLVLSVKMIFLFLGNMILFFRRKKKDELSQKIHGHIFSVYMYECYKYITLLPKKAKKAKIIFSRRNILKGDISGIAEKDDIHPRKCGISVEMRF